MNLRFVFRLAQKKGVSVMGKMNEKSRGIYEESIYLDEKIKSQPFLNENGKIVSILYQTKNNFKKLFDAYFELSDQIRNKRNASKYEIETKKGLAEKIKKMIKNEESKLVHLSIIRENLQSKQTKVKTRAIR